MFNRFALKSADAETEPFLKHFQNINLLLTREGVLIEEPLEEVGQRFSECSKGI